MSFLRWILYLPPGASTAADGVDALHGFVISVTMIMSTFVFLMAALFTARHQRESEHTLTKQISATVLREGIVVVGLLALFILWWLIGYRQYVHMVEPPAGAEVVYVQAKQWMWKFAYPDGRSSNDVLTVPAGRPVKLVMTSRDVIHSFYVPPFRIKQDVVPGRYTMTWFEAKSPGVYPIWCAEYCGTDHSMMRGEVVVLNEADYARWRSGRAMEIADLDCGGGPGSCGGADIVKLGLEASVRRSCVACHTLDGQPHVGPTWSRLYGSIVELDGGRTVLADEAYLTKSMMEPGADVVKGFQNVMPTYQGTLTAPEAAAIVELIKSVRDGPAPRGVTLPSLQIRQLDAGGPP
jgi:cytochrome c oxidase subunit 2